VTNGVDHGSQQTAIHDLPGLIHKTCYTAHSCASLCMALRSMQRLTWLPLKQLPIQLKIRQFLTASYPFTI
jgi:hypothetical protein